MSVSPPGSALLAQASVKTLLWASAAVALLTITLKTLAWVVTGSVGLLSDAMESFVNVAGAVFALAMVSIAQRPADVDHPYGHHKAEYFSSGFEGILIVAAAAGILWAALRRLFDPQPLQALGWGLSLSIVSSAFNAALAWVMLRVARVRRSIALEADARHLATDVWTSAGVVLGLGLVALTGWLWLDPVVAIAVALNIVREGARLVWRSSQGLMDEAVEPEVLETVRATLADFEYRHGDALIVRFDHVRTRQAGQRRFADLHMHVPADWTLGRAAALRQSVEQALMSAVPGLRVTIQLLPSDVEPQLDDDKDLM